MRYAVMFTKTTGQKRRLQAPAPISSRFLCPLPPISLSAPNQNRHATQASPRLSLLFHDSLLSFEQSGTGRH